MKNIFKVILIVAGGVFTIYCLYYFRTILTYILLAGFFSLLGRPLMRLLRSIRIRKYRLPKSLCAAITLFSFFLVIFGFMALFLPLLVYELRMITMVNTEALMENLSRPLAKIDDFVNKFQVNGEVFSSAEFVMVRFVSLFNSSSISGFFSTFVGLLGNIFAAVFSISFITFFFLIDQKRIYRSVSKVVPPKMLRSFNNVVFTTERLLTRYFIGLLIQLSLIASLVTIGMLMFEIEHALLIGFFAGVINIIPYIGPVIGWVFGLFIGLTTSFDFDFYTFGLPVLVQISSVFATVQLLDNTFFQPLIFSSSIRAHPLEIFILLWIAGTIAGVPGMILGIPCYTILRVIVTELLTEFHFLQPSGQNTS